MWTIFEKILSDPFNVMHLSDEVHAGCLVAAVFLVVVFVILLGIDK